MPDLELHFDSCFDDAKLARVVPLLPRTFAALNAMAPWRRGRWPTRIERMSDRDIVEGRARGAGHGATYVPGSTVWLNPHLSWQGTWMVLIHEWGHHAWEDASENELNQVLVPMVYKAVTGHKLDMNWARRHGIGPPCPWGDRGFVGDVPRVCRR